MSIHRSAESSNRIASDCQRGIAKGFAMLATVAVLFGPIRTAAGSQPPNRLGTGKPTEASVEPTYLKGLSNAEDLVRLAGTPWIIASDMAIDRSAEWPRYGPLGPLSAVRADTHEVSRLYPAPDAALDWDRKMFPDFSAPPENLVSHGLNIQPLGMPGSFRLYVVNHGGRESVEVFDVQVNHPRLKATWRGGIRAPEGVRPNSVVPLPQSGIALSGGGVAIWRPERGWTKVEGIEDGNGIEASRDGQWLFVNESNKCAVVRVPVAGGTVQKLCDCNSHPDNIRWGDDGCLYIVSQIFSEDPWTEYEKRKAVICDVGFAVVQLNPEGWTAKELLRCDGFKGAFGAGTTALKIGNELWIGTFWGDRVAIFKLGKSPRTFPF